jgi:hypothetical protein
MRRGGLHIVTLLLLALPVPASSAPDRPAKKDSRPGEALQIEMHVGIPGYIFIGQPLAEVRKKFPEAKVVPFSGQKDAMIVKIAEAGISCIAVGPAEDLKVASVGFNVDGVHNGVSEGNFRTGKGIGKGSTVNDVLEAYGQPVEILGQQPSGALKRKVAPDDDPSVPKMYQYASSDGSVKTYFLVVDHLVKRIVVNQLAPLDEHIVKGGPQK